MASDGRESRSVRRIGPESSETDNMVEIRPKRRLRIRHLNPKDRDEKFEKEMQAYLQYREYGGLGLSASVPAHILSQRSMNSNKGLEAPPTSNQNGSSTVDLNPHTVSALDRQTSNQSDGLNLSHRKIKLHSPSSNSVNSDGGHSVSGVQVSVNRPSSEVQAMSQISESSLEADIESHILSSRKDGQNLQPQISESPRKTKDYRPVSARSLKRGKKSLVTDDFTDTLSSLPTDLNSSSNTHLSSPYKDVTLFFIHGVGGSADIWNAQLEFFSSLGMEVIAPDLIGHGFSSSPDSQKAYHFNEILADMEKIFDKYCKRQNIVIGHSYGCAFAACLARRRARRVTKLVLISSGAPIPLAPQPGVFSLPVCMLSCVKPCLFSKFERNAFHNPKMSGLSREQAFDLPVYVLSYMMKGQDWLDGDELYHQWLTQPTLLLHGKHDKFISVEEEEDMKEAIYCSQLVVIDNASHMVMMEAPQQVNQAMYEFIFQEHHEPPDTDRPKTRLSSARSSRSHRHRHKQMA